MRYPSWGGCSEAGHCPMPSWFHARSHQGRSCFVPYLVFVLENELLNTTQTWGRDILKIGQYLFSTSRRL